MRRSTAINSNYNDASGYPQRVAGRLYRTAPTMAPIGAFFYEPRVTRGDVVRLHLSPRSGI